MEPEHVSGARRVPWLTQPAYKKYAANTTFRSHVPAPHKKCTASTTFMSFDVRYQVLGSARDEFW